MLFLIQLGPMTVPAARGETLCQTTIRKFLEGAVNPSEAKSIFHDINIGENSRRWNLASAHDYPALLLLGVILLQPGSEL